MPGRVVLLHGTSSSGKTTLARAVQELSDDPWIRLGIDSFWNAIDERWMERGPRAADGFAWADDATIVPGPVGQRLAAGMRAAVAACARAGNDMLVDDGFIDPAWLDGWRHELADLDWFLSAWWHRSRCSKSGSGPGGTGSSAKRARSST